MKRRQPFTCFNKPEDPEMRTKETQHPGANERRGAALAAFRAGRGARNKKRPWGVGVNP